MFLPTNKQFEERQKVNLTTFGKKYGMHVPKCEILYDLSKVSRLTQSLISLLLLKENFMTLQLPTILIR